MTIETLCLLGSALLLVILGALSGALYGAQIGQPALMGNRDNVPDATGIAGRARRAHGNLLENLLPFAIVIVLAQSFGQTSAVTGAAAVGFLSARVVHAAAYLAGITGLRTLAWLTGLVSTLVIGIALLL